MDNAIRKDILARAKTSGYPGNIVEAFRAYDQGRDLVQEYVQQQQEASQPQMQVAQTPQEQEQGLRPYHEQGQTNQSMVFPNVQPNQSFNTMGMMDDIDVEKFDKQGNLVESYKSVPPGIVNLPTGPYEGTVIESPARMQKGGAKEMPLDLPLKEQNIYLVPEYNQPKANGYILPDPDRPELLNTGATEYKYSYGTDKGEVQVPSIISGQYIGDKAYDRYEASGEEFKPMADPGSYSKFYDEINRLGLMKKKQMGGSYQTNQKRRYQTAGLEEEDTRTLESGTIVDKGTNTLNIIDKGKITKTFPVLTGQAGKNPKTDINKAVGTLDDLETNPAGRSTPTGIYMMSPESNLYGWPGYSLNPIPAFGQPAPEANDTAIHITYGATPKSSEYEGHSEPAEFNRRNAAYKKNSSMRYLSYGCTNAQGEAIECLENTFPKGDTAIYVDSRFNRDSKFLSRFKNQEAPTPVVEEEPTIAQQPEERPISYTFDPEFGTVVSNPIEVTPTIVKKKARNKSKKKETGGPDTTAEISMYEWKSGLPEDSRKRYFIGGLKNRVLYNKAKYKR